MNEDTDWKRSTKHQTVRRHLAGMSKAKTLEDTKRLKEKAKARRAAIPKRNRGRAADAWLEDEGDELQLERMTSSSDLLPTRAANDQGSRGPEREPEADGEMLAQGAEALVLSVARTRARVLVDGETLDALLAVELASDRGTSLAVGDLVALDRPPGGPARILAVHPRRSSLSRADPGNAHRERVIAANVDVAVVVLSVKAPPLKPGLIDRFLIAVERGGVRPFLCINKLDLLEDDRELRAVERLLEPYRAIGVGYALVSAATGAGLDDLRRALAGRTVVFVGHSGVGKSSLLNALDPDGARHVGAVRASDGKGRHTTTASMLYELPAGTRVIDTPGVRQFGLWELDQAGLLAAFPELEAIAAACRFTDCAHLSEPACAVRAAVDRGSLPRSRYDAYLRLLKALPS
ncbi:MAG: ribosome small subunit-dependent GTPase A [Planctomycetota bacterium]|nr:MAG: ribosome small subunit-dependent GTPase A [Planctomycetota bacterium]